MERGNTPYNSQTGGYMEQTRRDWMGQRRRLRPPNGRISMSLHVEFERRWHANQEKVHLEVRPVECG